ncbi:hypothetical protein ACFL0Y_03840 [Patescibacteria group bacterium]
MADQQDEQKIMAQLRKPIDELINSHYAKRPIEERLRLRQLSWQAVDVLVREGYLGRIEEQDDIKRIIRNIKELGASPGFIEKSLRLAVLICKEMETDYPFLWAKYGGKYRS